MHELDKKPYLDIAKDVSVFTKDEIEGIEETLGWYIEAPNTEFFLIDEKDGSKLLGYAMFGRAPITAFSWDLYWLLVAKDCQGKGIGRKLLNRLEESILKIDNRVVLRVETSTKREFIHARNLYNKLGYIEAGRIPDFYAQDDDLIIYYKHVVKS
jgi:ribosomal protein S18 acetylase RimI-like enzyme